MNTKLAANYGTIAGLIAFAYFILLAVLGQNPIGEWSMIAAVFPIYFMYAATKKYREIDMGGSIRYGQAFIFSLTTAFFYATIFAALVYVYGSLIDNELVDVVKTDLMKNMDKMTELMGDNNKFVDEAIKKIENYTLGQIAMSEYWNKIIWGFILSLIIAGILKKEKPLFDDTDTNV